MATALRSDEFEGQILQTAKHTWTLGRCVGRGTCSVVLEVVGMCNSSTNLKKAREIKGAVKIFKQGPQFEAAGANEMEILEYLNRQGKSDNKAYVVHLLDYFSHRGLMHLAYERLSCNLHHILLKNSGEGLPLYIIKECSQHILRALSFLAASEVIHGDVKLSNIMWNANRGMFQLVDFALSFLQGNQPYQPLQSPGYQSPEVRVWNRLIADGTADRSYSRCCCASDTWSFAYVLWYIYTGRPGLRCEIDSSVCDMCIKDDPCIHFKEIKSHLPRDERKIPKEQHELFLDFLVRMIKCRPEQRVVPDDALQHRFLEPADGHQPIPSLSDLLLLPTTTLLLDNIYLENDSLKDVEETCAAFGVIRRITRGSEGKVLAVYYDADDCSRAHSALTGWIYNGRTVITCFYPAGKASDPGLFKPIIQYTGHDNERSDKLRKRSLDLQPDSSKGNHAKCTKSEQENSDVDLEQKQV